MRAFAFRVELDRLTDIQRPFHADIGMHQRPSIFSGHDYGLLLPASVAGSVRPWAASE
jgi:hypothetical protein